MSMNHINKLFIPSNEVKEFLDNYGKYIKVTGTVILLSILLAKVDIKESLRLFSEINTLILIPIFLYPVGILLSSIKWKTALESKDYSLIKLSNVYWVSNFFSNFLPSTIAGDAYKVVKLRKEFGYKKVFRSVILDRGSGLFAVLIMSSFLSIYTYGLIENPYISFISVPFIAGYLAFSLLTLKYFRNTTALVNNKINLKLVLVSVPFVILGAFSLWIYYFMYGYSLNFLIVLSFYCLIQLISMLPISINGWGLNEGSLVFLFSLIGIPATVSLSIAILSRITLVLVSGVGGLMYLLERNHDGPLKVIEHKLVD